VIAAIKRDKLNEKKSQKSQKFEEKLLDFLVFTYAEPFCLSLYVY